MVFPFEFLINDDPKILEGVYAFQGGVVEGVYVRLATYFVCNVYDFTLADVEGQVPLLGPGMKTVDIISV